MDNRFRLLSAEPLISGYRLQVQCGEAGRPISMSSCQVTREAAIDDIRAQLARLGIELDLTPDGDAEGATGQGWAPTSVGLDKPPSGDDPGSGEIH